MAGVRGGEVGAWFAMGIHTQWKRRRAVNRFSTPHLEKFPVFGRNAGAAPSAAVLGTQIAVMFEVVSGVFVTPFDWQHPRWIVASSPRVFLAGNGSIVGDGTLATQTWSLTKINSQIDRYGPMSGEWQNNPDPILAVAGYAGTRKGECLGPISFMGKAIYSTCVARRPHPLDLRP